MAVLKETLWERISEAFYKAKTSKEQILILLSDEDVDSLLRSSAVNFKNGDLIFEKCGDKIDVGIDSSKIKGPHAYVRTFNNQSTCAVQKIDDMDIRKITL